VHLTLTGNHRAFELAPTYVGTNAGQDWYRGTLAFRTYVDAGADVSVSGYRNVTSGTTVISAVMSGYYINVP
jgi:hypothetical protein